MHVVIALWVKLVLGMNNLYPWFSWEFFSYVPNPEYTYSMEVYMVDGQYYDPPIPFSETRYLAEEAGLDSTVYYFLARDLGKALDNDDVERADELDDQLRTMFSGKSHMFTIIKVYHDPIDYWYTGTYTDKTIVKVYKES